MKNLKSAFCFLNEEYLLFHVFICCINIVMTIYYVVYIGVKNMANTTVNVRMDDKLKKKFDNICTKLGLSMTTAITIFVKKTIRENRLPFEVSLDYCS